LTDKGVIQLAAAAYAGWVLERTKKALKEAGAISEGTAKTPKELKLDEKWLKMSANTVIPSGVFATKDGRYYLVGKKRKGRMT
jgi:hypothetical protein